MDGINSGKKSPSEIVLAFDRVLTEAEYAPPEAAKGADTLVYVRQPEGNASPGIRLLSSIIKKVTPGGGDAEFEMRFVDPSDKDGSVWIKTRLRILASGGGGILVCAGLEDITDQKILEKRRKNQQMKEALDAAHTDRSTGVYNKCFTEDIIRDRLCEMNGLLCMLFILDIDYLKHINDTFGHPVGDKVIETVAWLMRGRIREGDVLGRIGGDEFMGLICGLPDEAAARGMVERMLAAISQTTVNGYGISASVGCVMTEAGRENFDTLYRKADKALYHVKRNCKSNYDFYTSEND